MPAHVLRASEATNGGHAIPILPNATWEWAFNPEGNLQNLLSSSIPKTDCGFLGYMYQIRTKLSTSQKVDGLLFAMLGGPKMFVVTHRYHATHSCMDSTIYKRYTSKVVNQGVDFLFGGEGGSDSILLQTFSWPVHRYMHHLHVRVPSGASARGEDAASRLSWVST